MSSYSKQGQSTKFCPSWEAKPEKFDRPFLGCCSAYSNSVLSTKIYTTYALDIYAHLATNYDTTLIQDVVSECNKIMNDKTAGEDEKRTVTGCVLSLAINGTQTSSKLTQIRTFQRAIIPFRRFRSLIYSIEGWPGKLLSNNRNSMSLGKWCEWKDHFLMSPGANRWNKKKKEKASTRLAFFIKSNTPNGIHEMVPFELFHLTHTGKWIGVTLDLPHPFL